MPYIGQSLTEGTRREYTYVATASQTTFNAIYTVGAVDVYQNGVLLAPSDYTATTGTTVVFNTGAALNDEITIHCHNTFSVADTVSASQGGTFNSDVSFGDNNKVIFGAGSDLHIYHDGSNSYVADVGTGNLKVRGEDLRLEDTSGNRYLQGVAGGATTLYYAGSVVANTTSTGVDVIGTVTADGLTVDTDTLYVDSTNNRLGINTTGPLSALDMRLSHTPVARTDVAGTFDGDGLYQYFVGLNDDAWGSKQVGGVYSRWKSGGTMNWCGIDFIDARSSSSGGHKSQITFRTRDGGSGDRAVVTVSHTGTVYPVTDNSADLGGSSVRWNDVYATNATIQTSDENEKQHIAALTDAEIIAAKAISKLFKTFKWNSAVEAKGDAARTHTGVIAQQVDQAMTDAGLNADDYAFFVRAVHYTDTVDGRNIVFDYDDDERTETATKHEKLAIRYPELLAFIGAATEQRLASIEARLDALEA